jgi:hypothetical protein
LKEWEDFMPARAITALVQVAKTFTIAGDHVAEILASVNDEIIVAGSTGNDGTYTVLGAVLDAGNTVISVDEAIADSTVDGTLQLNETAAWYTNTGHTTKSETLPGASSDVVLLTLPAAGPGGALTIASFDCTAVDADVPDTLTLNITVTGAVVSGHAGRTHNINCPSVSGDLTMNVEGAATNTVLGGVATFNGATNPDGADFGVAPKVVWNSTGTPGPTYWPVLVEAHKAIDLTGAAQVYSAPTVIQPMNHSATVLIGNAGDTGTVQVDPSRLPAASPIQVGG